MVTFCGHGKIVYDNFVQQRLYKEIEAMAKNGESSFLLGGYGNFDLIAASAIKAIKEKYSNVKSILVLAYLDQKYNEDLYDETIYPDIENVPRRYAIVKRNQWMIDKSDVVISYLEHSWGGAAKTFDYAMKKKKTVINVAFR